MVSLIIPAYNEERGIASALLTCRNYLAGQFPRYQLILVDDGSTDRTLKEARRIEGVHILSYAGNRGKGYAVRRGMQIAQGDAVFFTDADLPYDLGYLSRGFRMIEEGTDVVIGSRSSRREGYPPLRRVLSRGCQALSGRMLRSGEVDTQCGFKGVARRVIREVLPMARIDDFGFDMELLYLARKYGMKIQSIPVLLREHRKDSRVRYFSDTWRVARDMLRIRSFDRKEVYGAVPVSRGEK